jgi:hypothetical protein
MQLFFRTLLLSLILVGGAYSQEPASEINSPLVNVELGQDDALCQAIEALSVSGDSGLTAQQRLDLIKDLGQMRTANSAINSDKAHAGKFDIEGFLAILLIFSTPILAIYVSYRKKERVYQTIDKAIDKGIEVPSSLLEAVEISVLNRGALR